MIAEIVVVTLTAQEATALAHCEARISRGLESFIATGEALSTIRDGRLYRAIHTTFAGYCLEKWGFKRAHAYRLMTAAITVSPIGDKSAITTESQTRELSRIEPERRQLVIEKAVAATGGKITAIAIREAAEPPAEEPAPIEATHEEIEETVSEPTTREVFTPQPRAIDIARSAVTQLEKQLQPNDSERIAGIKYIRNWCNTEIARAAPKPNPKLKSDAPKYAEMAVLNLERINKQDPRRAEAFDEVLRWIEENRGETT